MEERAYEKKKQLTDEEQMERRKQAAERKRKRESVEKESRRVKVKAIPRSLRRVREEFAVNIPPPSVASIRTPVVAQYPRPRGYDRRQGSVPFIQSWAATAPIAQESIRYQYRLPMERYIRSAPGTLGYQMATQGTTETLQAPQQLPSQQLESIMNARAIEERDRQIKEKEEFDKLQEWRQEAGEQLNKALEQSQAYASMQQTYLSDYMKGLGRQAIAQKEAAEAQQAIAQAQAEQADVRLAQAAAERPGLTGPQEAAALRRVEQESAQAQQAAAQAAIQRQEAFEAAKYEEDMMKELQKVKEQAALDSAFSVLQMDPNAAAKFYEETTARRPEQAGEPLPIKIGSKTIATIQPPVRIEGRPPTSNVIASDSGKRLAAAGEDEDKRKELVKSFLSESGVVDESLQQFPLSPAAKGPSLGTLLDAPIDEFFDARESVDDVTMEDATAESDDDFVDASETVDDDTLVIDAAAPKTDNSMFEPWTVRGRSFTWVSPWDASVSDSLRSLSAAQTPVTPQPPSLTEATQRVLGQQESPLVTVAAAKYEDARTPLREEKKKGTQRELAQLSAARLQMEGKSAPMRGFIAGDPERLYQRVRRPRQPYSPSDETQETGRPGKGKGRAKWGEGKERLARTTRELIRKRNRQAAFEMAAPSVDTLYDEYVLSPPSPLTPGTSRGSIPQIVDRMSTERMQTLLMKAQRVPAQTISRMRNQLKNVLKAKQALGELEEFLAQ